MLPTTHSATEMRSSLCASPQLRCAGPPCIVLCYDTPALCCAVRCVAIQAERLSVVDTALPLAAQLALVLMVAMFIL